MANRSKNIVWMKVLWSKKKKKKEQSRSLFIEFYVKTVRIVQNVSKRSIATTHRRLSLFSCSRCLEVVAAGNEKGRQGMKYSACLAKTKLLGSLDAGNPDYVESVTYCIRVIHLKPYLTCCAMSLSRSGFL